MTANHSLRNQAGFTLVELLTVMAIVMILAGLTVGGLSYFNRKIAEDKTRLQLKLISNGLEAYHSDYGEYPLAGDNSGKNQSNELYLSLFYDTDDDGQAYDDPEETQEIYVPEMDPSSTSQGWISGSGMNVKLIDGFGNEFRYRRMSNPAAMRNPDFDLWSVGADGRTNAGEVEHEYNNDDIWEH